MFCMMFQSYDFGNETKECLRRPLRGARSNIMGVARGSETRWTANLVHMINPVKISTHVLQLNPFWEHAHN